jgi:16S rRNA (adenine1518-N6/adenine1519-N6)-dimethyltransferase
MSYRAKKHLGQNFLKSKTVVDKMITTADISRVEKILEIGPGKGSLTGALLKTGVYVIAIEKDRDLLPILREKFKTEISNGKMSLIEEDVLNFDPSKHPILSTSGYKLVANIPYYITGEILQKFLSSKSAPSKAVLLVQKEVAQRIVAKDGKSSILSISVKAFGEPKLVMNVSKKYFSPAPKVDSAILLIDRISKKNFSEISEKKFFEIVRAGFSHKRKVLSGNLSQFSTKESIETFLKEHGHSVSARAEELSVNDWVELTKALKFL